MYSRPKSAVIPPYAVPIPNSVNSPDNTANAHQPVPSIGSLNSKVNNNLSIKLPKPPALPSNPPVDPVLEVSGDQASSKSHISKIKQNSKGNVKRKSEERKSKKDREAEVDESTFMDLEFDKSLFPYNRLKNFSGIHQIEAKAKVKTGSWNERYLILFCDYIVYFDTKFGFIPPRDFEKPLGAIPLVNTKFKEIKEFEDKMDLEGLVPKLISYDFCIELPVHVSSEKVNNFLLQFENQETVDIWLNGLRLRSKELSLVKDKMDFAATRLLLDELLKNFPINSKLKDPPSAGEEDLWLERVISYWNTRVKHRKDLRRAQLFSCLNTIQYRNYIEWFVTPGGESGKASLEREIITAEDTVISGWSKAISEQYPLMQRQFESLDPDDQEGIGQALGISMAYYKYVQLYNRFYSNIYPERKVTDIEGFGEKWKDLVDRLTIVFENSQSKISAQDGGAQDDDPFSDIQVVKF